MRTTLVLSALAIGLCAGCGSDTDDPPTDPNGQEPATTEPAPPPPVKAPAKPVEQLKPKAFNDDPHG
jgi:hypothetical protein